MIVHRNYKPDTFENDIALLELESAFEIQPHVIPICLPDADDTDDYVGLVAHVAGWGKLSYGKKSLHIGHFLFEFHRRAGSKYSSSGETANNSK